MGISGAAEHHFGASDTVVKLRLPISYLRACVDHQREKPKARKESSWLQESTLISLRSMDQKAVPEDAHELLQHGATAKVRKLDEQAMNTTLTFASLYLDLAMDFGLSFWPIRSRSLPCLLAL